MEQEDIPLRRSKRELRVAATAVESMRSAASPEELFVAWQTFLDRLEKVWIKAERECQAFRSSFEPWQCRFKKTRSDDDLLLYLHHARHADQHTIQPTAVGTAGGIQLSIPANTTIRVSIDRAAGRLTFHGLPSVPTLLPPGYLLLPFKNRGVTYNPPRSHLGAELADYSPIAVAELGLAFYAGFLREVEERFFPRANGSAS